MEHNPSPPTHHIPSSQELKNELEAVLEQSQARQREVEALLRGTQAVLHYRSFTDAAKAIFDSCCELTGAVAGYVALLTPDGQKNDVLFLEAGGLPCSVDPNLPMPIRGLRADAYRTKEVVYDNHFSQSEWTRFLPPGHVELPNVLFAPLLLDGEPAGLLGLSNKPGGFTPDDARIVRPFAELASVALQNSRSLDNLRAREEKLRVIAQNVQDVIWVATLDGDFTYVNSAVERLYGYTPNEFLALSCEDLFPPEEWKLFQRKLHKFPAAEDWMFRQETQQLRHNGTRFWAEITLSPLCEEEGPPLGFLGVTHDITHRRRAEEERKQLEARLQNQQKLESLGTLASGVAHEINNPLNIIMNYAQLIEDRLDKENTLHAFAHNIIHETERIATIVRHLLTFAHQRQEEGAVMLMSDVVERILPLIGATLRKDQIAIEARIKEGLPPVRCRSQQLQQVLLNLMTNARDALNERFPSSHPEKMIRLTMNLIEDNGERWVRTTIEDQGQGIPPHQLQRIFDPFFTTKPRNIGTGLGLSISYGIVKDHQGELSVESKPNEGSRFHLDLPVYEPKKNREETKATKKTS